MTLPARAALLAVVLSAAAVFFNALSIPRSLRPTILAHQAPAATVDVSMVITGLGAPGAPAEHHFYNPQMVVARRGDTIRLRVMNLTTSGHAIQVEGYDARTRVLLGGEQQTIGFVATRGGVFPYRCYLPYDPATGACSPDHETMMGYLVVLDPPP